MSSVTHLLGAYFVQDRATAIAELISSELWPTTGTFTFYFCKTKREVHVAERLGGSDPVVHWKFPLDWLTDDNWEERAKDYVREEKAARKQKREYDEKMLLRQLKRKYPEEAI